MYEIFQELLAKKGLKAFDVSKATGISSSTLTDWKKGRSIPKQDKMQKIANYLGVSVEYLMTGKEPDVNLRIDGIIGFEAILADIYGACKMEGVMGEYGECLYFSIGTGKSRYALEENDFDRLYHSVKQTIRQMTDLLIKDELIVRHECKKTADIPPSLEQYSRMRKDGIIIESLEELYGFNSYLNAAHARTDIDIPEGTDTSDNDIMDDENF